jgi:hypothetical protein
MRKGQVFTIDFMISVAIFIIVLMLIVMLWFNLDIHIKEVESRRDMHTISLSIADSFVRSTGYPIDWNSTNVQSVGLAKEEYVLDLNKYMSLASIPYDSARSTLRLGNYHFSFSMTDINGYNVSTGVLRSPVAYFCNTQCSLLDKMNSSGAVWDIYQASGFDISNQYNERYYYLIGSFGMSANEETFFNETVANLSEYKTLILEDPDVRNDQVNTTAIRQFLENGGTVLVSSQGAPGTNIIDEDFGMHSENLGGQGIVNTSSLVFMNVSAGNSVQFASSSWRYYREPGDAPLTMYVHESTDSSRCLICSWAYEKGQIFFVEDFDGQVSPPGGPLLSDVLNLPGSRAKCGVDPSNSTIDVIAITRISVLEGFFREPVSIKILIWR